jgi:hypothetical protein
MISWLSTIDPQTTFVQSYSFTAGPAFEGIGGTDGATNGSSSSEENFFFTRFVSTFYEGDNIVYDTVVNSRGSEARTTSTSVSYTQGAAIVESTTSERAVYTTTEIVEGEKTFTTTGASFITANSTKLVSAAVTRSSYALTQSGSQYIGDIYATIYLAQDSEVLFVAQATAITGEIYSGAAADVATTTTQTTIWPQSATMTVSRIDASEIPAFSIESTERSTQTFGFRSIGRDEPTTVTSYFAFTGLAELPLPSATFEESPFIVESETVTVTIEEESIVGYNFSRSTALTTQVRSKQEISDGTIVADATYYVPQTRSAIIEDTLWTTSQTEDVVVGNAQNITATTDHSATRRNYPVAYHNATSQNFSPGRRSVYGPQGWADSTDSVYSIVAAPFFPEVYGDNWFVSVSRSVLSFMPSSFLAYSGTGTDFQTYGTISFSHYSASLFANSNTDPNNTEPEPAVFLPQSQAPSGLLISDTVVGAYSLNSLQTGYQSFARGVYREKGGDTVYKDIDAESFVSGSSVDRLTPVTCFGFDSGTSTAIVWPAPRNSTALSFA